VRKERQKPLSRNKEETIMAKDLTVILEDRPGAFGDVTRRIANAGVNIDLAYPATNNRLVIGADDLDKARAAV